MRNLLNRADLTRYAGQFVWLELNFDSPTSGGRPFANITTCRTACCTSSGLGFPGFFQKSKQVSVDLLLMGGR